MQEGGQNLRSGARPVPRCHPGRVEEGVLNIETELDYWRGVIPRTEFAQISLRFSHFVPTIKFGYDCYLLFHHSPLCNLLPDLRERYDRIVPSNEQLEWRWADQIIRHAWGRMSGEQRYVVPTIAAELVGA